MGATRNPDLTSAVAMTPGAGSQEFREAAEMTEGKHSHVHGERK